MNDHTLFRARIAAVAAVLVVTGGCLIGLLVGGWDPALLAYAVATAIGAGCLVERLAIWAQRPPTAALLRRGFAAAATPANWPPLLTALAGYFLGNDFVAKRGTSRWLAHWPIAIGCVMALAIVMPLVLGWIHFVTPAADSGTYQIILLGIPTITFPIDSLFAAGLFHGLVFASGFVLFGVAVATWRRLTDRGDQAVQDSYDVLPLVILAALAITGLFLTASYTWFGGAGYEVLAPLHAVTVVAFLIQLPYGKLLHVPQRSLKLAQFFADADDATPATCSRCGSPFAGVKQIDELKKVTAALGFSYELPDGAHYQDICPRCRRTLLVTAQGARWRAGRDIAVPMPEYTVSAGADHGH